MQILPKIRSKFGEPIGVEVFVQPPDFGENEKTFISVNAAAGVSTFTVENGLKFSVGEYLIVGNVGAETSEIVRIHTSTTPTAPLITLNAVTSFAHSRGERLLFIPYNQVVVQRSTDGGVNYSDLATIDLRVDTTEIYYNDATGLSTYYYRAKFKNSASSSVSEVSDGVIATGFVENSAGAIIRDALVSLGETMDPEVLTKEFLFRALDEGRDEIDLHQNIERWSFRTVFDYDAGNVLSGSHTLTVPTDLRDPNTFKNVLSVRVGRDNLPLTQVDKRALNDHYRGVAHATIVTPITGASTTLVLSSTGDFDDSGAVTIAASTVAETLDTVDYTTNTVATATLSGVTGIADSKAAGIDVWQGASFGYPVEYTVYENKIVFSQPFEDDLAGENIWLDYYKKKTIANSEGDLLDEPFYRIYLPYMRYRIKLRKNPQMVNAEDADYVSWVEKREAQAAKEFTGQDIRIMVDIPDRNYRGIA